MSMPHQTSLPPHLTIRQSGRRGFGRKWKEEGGPGEMTTKNCPLFSWSETGQLVPSPALVNVRLPLPTLPCLGPPSEKPCRAWTFTGASETCVPKGRWVETTHLQLQTEELHCAFSTRGGLRGARDGVFIPMNYSFRTVQVAGKPGAALHYD